jgi:glycosyltransferase involved in cell wall biosynthesis
LKHYVYTSVNLNYLGRALTLARSLGNFDSSIHFVLVVVEPFHELSPDEIEEIRNIDDGRIFHEVLTLKDIETKDIKGFENYSVIEMCTSIKGKVSTALLERSDSAYVTYLDPDLYFYDSINVIREAHEKFDVLLTPHIINPPLNDFAIWNDEVFGTLRHGIFNLGFVSFKKTDVSKRVSRWWADRLNVSCSGDYSSGVFTDQKWWDLSIVYFPEISIVKDFGWNMAPWNLEERNLVSLHPPMLSNGEALIFFHYSKFPSNEFSSKVLKGHNTRLLNQLFLDYEKEFLESQRDVSEFLELRNSNQSLKTELEITVAKRHPKVERALEKIVIALAKNQKVKILTTKSRTLKTLGRFIYHSYRRYLYRTSSQKDLQHQISFESALTYRFDVLILTHYGGGGVEEFVRGRRSQLSRTRMVVAVLRPGLESEYLLEYDGRTYVINEHRTVENLFKNSSELEIHHLLGLEEFIDVLPNFRLGTIYLHDRYFISQRPFSDSLAFLKSPIHSLGINRNLNQDISISDEAWSKSVSSVLSKGKVVVAPSKFIQDEFLIAYPDLKIEVVGLEKDLDSHKAVMHNDKILRIIVISPTGEHKGVNVISSLAKLLQSKSSKLVIEVFGELGIYHSAELGDFSNVKLHGQVPRERMTDYLIRSNQIIGWIPSLTGESYSLATSDFISAEVPVVATNLGALPERLSSRSNCFLYNPGIPLDELANFFCDLSIGKEMRIGSYPNFVQISKC